MGGLLSGWWGLFREAGAGRRTTGPGWVSAVRERKPFVGRSLNLDLDGGFGGAEGGAVWSAAGGEEEGGGEDGGGGFRWGHDSGHRGWCNEVVGGWIEFCFFGSVKELTRKAEGICFLLMVKVWMPASVAAMC